MLPPKEKKKIKEKALHKSSEKVLPNPVSGAATEASEQGHDDIRGMIILINREGR